jgi:hypothetical protein
MSRAGLCRCLFLFILIDAALGAALAWRAFAPREIVVVPGAPEERILLIGNPTEAEVRQFAVFFAINLDNFTPETYPAQEALIRCLVSPEGEKFGELLSERRRLAAEAGLASSLFVDPDTIEVAAAGTAFQAVLCGLRRHFIGGKLSWEAPFEYRIGLQRTPPTEGNPHGIWVTSLVARRIHEGAD